MEIYCGGGYARGAGLVEEELKVKLTRIKNVVWEDDSMVNSYVHSKKPSVYQANGIMRPAEGETTIYITNFYELVDRMNFVFKTRNERARFTLFGVVENNLQNIVEFRLHKILRDDTRQMQTFIKEDDIYDG